MHKHYYLYILFFFVPTLKIFSQTNISSDLKYHKGFLVSQKGDTISGLIGEQSDKNLITFCIFKPTDNDPPTHLGPIDVAAYFNTAGDEKYVSTKVHSPGKDTLIFSKVLFEGSYDLLYYEFQNVKHFITKKPDSTLYDIGYPPFITKDEYLSGMTSAKKFKQLTDSIFIDYPDLPEYEKGVKPEISSLIELFKEYHEINGSSYNIHAEKQVYDNTMLPKDFHRGFIINKEGDTLNGFIRNQNEETLIRTCSFKPVKSENFVQFGTSDLAGFGTKIDNKLFVPTLIHSKKGSVTAFSRLIFDGEIDLLYYKVNRISHFLIRNPDSTISDIIYPPVLTRLDYLSGLNTSKKFNKETDSVFAETKAAKYLARAKPKIKSMIKSLKNYHESSGIPFKIYYGNPRYLYIGPVAGVSFDNYVMELKNNGFKSFSQPSPYAGVRLELVNNKGPGILFEGSASYENHHYSYLIDNMYLKDYFETYFKGISINSRIGMTVNPFAATNLTFIEGGLMTKFYPAPDYTNYHGQVQVQENTIFSFQNHDDINSDFFYGVFIRTGLNMHVTRGNSLKLAGTYNLLRSSGTERIHSIEFSVCYLFKLK